MTGNMALLAAVVMGTFITGTEYFDLFEHCSSFFLT